MSWFEWREAPEGDFAVVGDPVSHSASPAMHSAAYRELGLDLTYRAIRVAPGELGAAFDRLVGLGYRGINVTVPLKEEAFTWCRSTEGIAGKVGAVNTVRLADRTGTNTDAPGFLRTLEELGVEARASVLVLGAGGTARALIPALWDGGYRVKAWNRTQVKLQDLVAEFAIPVSILDTPDPEGCAVVLNTTSASLQGQAVPVEWSRALAGAVAYDMMYGAEPTQFLRDAEAAGLKTVDGKMILVEQGALAFEWWLGKSAPRAAMLQAVHERA